MQVGKTVKRIAAISTAALMLGATLSGAFAAYNLADYAKPFLKDGVLDNTVIVVGKTAATSDVVGAIDVAAALQAEAVSKETITGGSVAPTIEDGVAITKSGDKFNYGEDLYDVTPEALDENDLPNMLAQGNFDDNEGDNKGEETYTQELALNDSTGSFLFTQPEDMKAGSYLVFDKNDRVYTYTLDFDSGVSFLTSAVSDDFEGNTIEIQGNIYTITEAKAESNILTKLKVVAGDSTVWLSQDQPYTLGDHTVTVVNVDDSGDSCGINVDGTTVWVDQGTTEDFGGMSVGVLDVKVVHAKDFDMDTCELSLGSNEIVLESGEPVEVNGVELDGTDVTFVGSAGLWDGFRISYQTGKEDTGVNSDDIYLSDGQAWTDPVFGNFKIVYSGLTADYENMKFTAGGDDATFSFTNNDGKTVEVPFHGRSNGNIMLGTDTDAPLLKPGDSYTGDPEGVLLFYTTSGGESHVLELSDVACGTASNKTTIKDVTYGTTVANDKELSADCSSATLETVSMGSLGNLQLNLSSNFVRFENSAGLGNGVPETLYEGNVGFTNQSINVTEKAGDEIAASTVSFTLTWDDTDDEITATGITGADTSAIDNDEGDDDTQWYRTDKGTLIKYDQEDKFWVEFMAPEEDVFASVFVAPLDAEVSSGSTGGSTADKVNPFSVGLAVLDEDASGMTKNMIVVGGPCVNTVAAELMENPEQCAEGFEPGKARLKFFDRSGKAALLVAGYDAEDTVNAAYVLAQHNKKYATQFKTLGEEVELVVTDMNEVVFNSVA